MPSARSISGSVSTTLTALARPASDNDGPSTSSNWTRGPRRRRMLAPSSSLMVRSTTRAIRLCRNSSKRLSSRSGRPKSRSAMSTISVQSVSSSSIAGPGRAAASTTSPSQVD